MRSPQPLHISFDRETNFLSGVAFGKVLGDRPAHEMLYLGAEIRLVFEKGRQSPIGFEVRDASSAPFDDDVHEAVWDLPMFTAPALGLTRASVGMITVAATAQLSQSTPDVVAAWRAMTTEEAGDLPQAARWWRRGVNSGMTEHHFQLGRVLLADGDVVSGYTHLRFFTEAHPEGTWGWTWRGIAAEAQSDMREARACYRRAVRLEQEGRMPTDAHERLAAVQQALQSRSAATVS